MTNKKIEIFGLDFWSAFGEKLVQYMELKPGTRVLDVGTGGGSCLIPAAKTIGSSGYAIGIDRWENRITETLENIKSNLLSNATAEIMDARELIYDDKTFDYVLCGFIGFGDVFDFQGHKYRNENDKMMHILRVLKDGGKAGFSTWESQGELDYLRKLLQDYLKNHTSKSQEEIKNVPISYSKETKNGFEKILQDVGFNEIDVFSENFTIRYENFDEWFGVMKRSGWILREILGKDELAINDFREKMLPHGIETFKQKNGSYQFKKSVIFAFGTK
ncbi:MAG: methyltransferase domain-containing protein [Candidatus Heimdallarchaeota archaeon]|nr:methyltransferase domain-containing protein [Candidatus Heimdallarchaeota archaeon]MBY8995797.1 methyltransferase domain-containing protein [Candidatus Heimdallarchaeota archaeon]